MKRSLSTGVPSVFGGTVATFVVTLVTTAIPVRYLGSDRYGDDALLAPVFAVLVILESSGVGDGVRTFVVEDRSVPDREANVVGYASTHFVHVAARYVGSDPIGDLRPVRVGATIVRSGAAIALLARPSRSPVSRWWPSRRRGSSSSRRRRSRPAPSTSRSSRRSPTRSRSSSQL